MFENDLGAEEESERADGLAGEGTVHTIFTLFRLRSVHVLPKQQRPLRSLLHGVLTAPRPSPRLQPSETQGLPLTFNHRPSPLSLSCKNTLFPCQNHNRLKSVSPKSPAEIELDLRRVVLPLS